MVSGTVRIAVRASDNRAVSKVVLMINGNRVATVAGGALDYSWSTRWLRGTYNLTAIAYDTSNIEARSTIQVRVQR